MLLKDTHGTVAAIDLGSNSFHMIVARVVDGQLHVLDRVRERIRLAAGLNEKKELTPEIQARALECFERLHERVKDMPPGSVRAVGTNTLRKAKNSGLFLKRAQKTLGHPIEVISGQEEARLVYLGVAHSLADDTGRRLVVDIGGGSTECIIGERFQTLRGDSLYMGCVSSTQDFFKDGRISSEGFRRAELAARLELRPMEQSFKRLGWNDAIGSSGTILAVADVLRLNDLVSGGITHKGLKKLKKILIEAQDIQKLSLSGLDPIRAQVFPGGVAILTSVFEALEIERMIPSTGALREGLLFDLLGRIAHEDVRNHTIDALSERYRVDREQAQRVERTGLLLLEQCEAWKLPRPSSQEFLSWGARLHEAGLSISYAGYHRHSAYLVANGEMPGFSLEDRQLLAALLRNHRRKYLPESLANMTIKRQRLAARLTLLLRLAVCLNRSRADGVVPKLGLTVKKHHLDLRFPEGWLESHHLTQADLAQEAKAFRSSGFTLDAR